MVRYRAPFVASPVTSMRNRPAAWASSLGPSPGLGSTRSSNDRVGPNDIPASPAPRATDVIPAAKAPVGPLP